MTPEEVVTLFRTEIADVATPQLWSDTEAYNYLDDAQTMFCRLTGGLPDSVSDLTQVALAVGDTTFEVDERILKIRDAYRSSDGRRLYILNREDMERMGMRFDGRQGPIEAIIIGMDETTAYLYPVPNVADTVNLVIDRLPLDEINEDNAANVELEIPRRHHRHLLYWMKKLAYEKQDAETFNKTKSLEFEAKFEKYCFNAKLEKDRRKHKPRSVAYGGLPQRAPVSHENKDY